jgi:DNA polymerase-3 subunit alpha/error-prone DNA polymerase
LAENDAGYRNLCRLITRRHAADAFDLSSVLPDYAKGLIVLVEDPKLLKRWYACGVTVAGSLPRRPTGQGLKLRQIARHLGVLTVATPASFFIDPQEYTVHRVLRAIERNTSLSRLSAGEVAPPDAWLAPVAKYRDRFAVWPETVQASEKIAERITFSGPRQEVVLPPWHDAQGRSSDQLLEAAAFAGARRRYGHDLPETVVDRLTHELKIIAQMGFSAYFLVVKDIVAHSSRICGRGSGAASLVAYSLGITNVCPIKHNLYFERFLNPGRLDPPDIDVDFAWDERDEILQTVLKQHAGHVAMVCNHVAFRPRMAIREVAKVLGLLEREISQVSKRLPWFYRLIARRQDLLTGLRELPEFQGIDFPHPWPQIFAIAQRIIGLPRYLSVHPGGVVITPGPIDAYVPVQPAPKGVPVIQWEKDATEEAGLVKIDLLGNRSLGVIRDCLGNMHRNGICLDESRWHPEDDPATQSNVARGRTMGCFYIESPAMRLLQKKAQMGDFEHLVIQSSIIRPAANEFIREYVRRLHGGAWEPIHPVLADVLDETYGIMVYQEDVSRAAVALAGFSHADADGLRKIMSKKDKHRKLQDYRQQFAEGARSRGLSESQIKAVWDMMMSFAGYSFCKPHSASYAQISFQAAYLKTHYPAEFMAAVISNQGGFYSTFAYVSEAQRMGVTILPPDVNRSEIRWQGQGEKMRVGWLSVKHLSRRTQKRIMGERQKGRYHHLENFLQRVQPDEREARALVQAGAFDGLHPAASRAALLWRLADWRHQDSKVGGQLELFEKRSAPSPPRLPTDQARLKMRQEFHVLGFLCDRHPMELFKNQLRSRGIVKAHAISAFSGRRIQVAGLLITGKVVHTKHGDPMEFLTFEDETGQVETTFFPEVYRRFCAMLDHSRPFILRGTVDEDFGVHTLTVAQVTPVAKPPLRA